MSEGESAAVLSAVGTLREQMRDPARDRRKSVNVWIGEVREACAVAHQAARSGDLNGEITAWQVVAALAVGRAEVVKGIASREGAGGSDQG